MIRDANGKLAITPGQWGVDVNAFGQRTVWSEDHRPLAILTHPGSPNAALFAEAGTVTNECGKTPRELLDLCREMRAALADIICDLPARRDWLNPVYERVAKAALAKSEGV